MKSKTRYSVLQHIAAVLIALSLLFILLITAIEAVVYWTPGWFEKEYTKYRVLAQVNGEMTMESALQVSDEMMDYLRGDREDLVVMTTIDGRTTEFFTDREKAHMADVRVLFVGALKLRQYALLGAAGLFLILLIVQAARKQQTFPLLAQDYRRTTLGAAVFTIVIAYLASKNFTAVFTTFHHIFFDNDLWILDPREDNLINLLPEGFFMDTAIRILIYFTVLVAAAGLLLGALGRRGRSSGTGRH